MHWNSSIFIWHDITNTKHTQKKNYLLKVPNLHLTKMQRMENIVLKQKKNGDSIEMCQYITILSTMFVYQMTGI